MKKYLFLLKPIFFIFNLLFATWLVFQIEKISPSDFGKYKYLFEDPPALVTPYKVNSKEYLKKVCSYYKSGQLDSLELEKQIDMYLSTPTNVYKTSR